MENTTINQLEKLIVPILEGIKAIDFARYGENKYGSEAEHTAKSLLSDLRTVVRDIATSIKAANKFMKLCTYDERHLLIARLTDVYLELNKPNPNLNGLCAQYEKLRTVWRPFSSKYNQEGLTDMATEISKVAELETELTNTLDELQSIKESIAEKHEEVDTFLNRLDEKVGQLNESQIKLMVTHSRLNKDTEELSERNANLSGLIEHATSKVSEIEELLAESKSNEKVISLFSTNVQEKENRLILLEQKIKENQEKLEQYENERGRILQDAEELINNARQALNYSTAEGISAAFQEKYESKKEAPNWFWLAGAIISMLGTIAIGVWIVLDAPKDPGTVVWPIILGRIAILPFPIIGAFFFANQYIRKQTLVEDYAYKMVLAKSMVGFADQIKKHGDPNGNAEYMHYMKTVLEEIHKDPLRKRDTPRRRGKQPSLQEVLDAVDKLVKIAKQPTE
jgi:hypothetical protein